MVLCASCKKKEGSIDSRSNVYCWECFERFIVHKFRSTFGRFKLVKPGQRLGFVLKDDVSSRVLVHLVRRCTQKDDKKRLQFLPFFMTLSVFNEPSGITNFCADQNVEIETVSISEQLYPEEEAHLLSLKTQCKTENVWQRLLSCLSNHCMLNWANEKELTHIVLPSTVTDIAAQVLADVCIGRGVDVATRAEYAYRLGGPEGVCVIQPLRDVTLGDIEAYASHFSLTAASEPPHTSEPGGTTAPEPTTLAAKCRQFVLSLSSAFPGTVTTVARTAEKMRAPDGSIVTCSYGERDKGLKGHLKGNRDKITARAQEGVTKKEKKGEEEGGDSTTPKDPVTDVKMGQKRNRQGALLPRMASSSTPETVRDPFPFSPCRLCLGARDVVPASAAPFQFAHSTSPSLSLSPPSSSSSHTPRVFHPERPYCYSCQQLIRELEPTLLPKGVWEHPTPA
eukprot:GCRY01002986.1.p1 GENE.GCRY01002986.1~~GCRY01002986.1.p1  ORF type:complete len:451 (+),score=67.08 GCRY01002986.1:142-1494(+)